MSRSVPREAELSQVLEQMIDHHVRGGSLDEAWLASVPEPLRDEVSTHAATLQELDLIVAEPGPEQAWPVLGTWLGDFQLVRQLGRGGMGVVYLAHQKSLGRQVALKVLGTPLTRTWRAVERFRREAMTAARLSHPHLVAVHEVGEAQGYLFFAMEYVRGASLANLCARLRPHGVAQLGAVDLRAELAALLADGPHDGLAAGRAEGTERPPALARTSSDYFQQVARIGVAIASGLHCAHAAGVIHRDVKPHNILVDAGLHARLSDFGLAWHPDQPGLSATGDMLGTPHYMSPEAASGADATLDARADVYSLGATLFELLTLTVPFPATSVATVLRRAASEDAPHPWDLNPALPAGLAAIVHQALARDPARRYPSAQALADDLERFLAGDAPVALAGERAVRRLVRKTSRLLGRHRTAVAACVASLALVGFGLSWQGSATSGILDVQGISPQCEVSILRMVRGRTPYPWEPVVTRQHASRFDLQEGEYLVLVRDPAIGYGEYRTRISRRESLSASLVPHLRPTAQVTIDMVRIPAGTYPIGCDQPPWRAGVSSALPAAAPYVNAYYLDRYEVTNAEFRQFRDATGYAAMPSGWWDGQYPAGHDREPVMGVSWIDATAYAEWAGKRLPTEVEWEIAARGANGQKYSFGETFDANKARYLNLTNEQIMTTGYKLREHPPLPVDQGQDISPFGIYHLGGNVAEWCIDEWEPRWLATPPVPTQFRARGQKVIRGHSLTDTTSAAGELAAAYRAPAFADDNSNPGFGFRCAKTALD